MSDRPFSPTPVRNVEMVLTAHASVAETAKRRIGWGQLDYLPVGLFGSVMGLVGLSVAWRLAHVHYGTPAFVARWIGVIAAVVFVAMSLGYAAKAAGSPRAVVAEFRHPIAGNLFGAALIDLLLLPILIAPASAWLARASWALGAIGMAVFAWLIVSRWISSRQQVAHATPVWIVPVVGLLDVPLALPSLGLPWLHGVMVFGLAVGLFFAVLLLTLIFSRLMFEPPMPDALQPSLLILVAPFSVGYSSYVATTGASDLFAQSLYTVMLFVLAVLLPRLLYLRSCCPFRVSWWAVSFPLAASAIAALRFATSASNWFTEAVAVLLLALASIAICGLLLRTLWGIAKGELRTLSG